VLLRSSSDQLRRSQVNLARETEARLHAMKILKAAIVTLLLAAVVSGAGRIRERECRSQVACDLMMQQTERIARAQLMEGYIRETMNLLGSLVGSLDEELEDMTRGLRIGAGERCPRVNQALEQLLSQRTSRQARQDVPLSTGIMEESTAQVLERRSGQVEEEQRANRNTGAGSGRQIDQWRGSNGAPAWSISAQTNQNSRPGGFEPSRPMDVQSLTGGIEPYDHDNEQEVQSSNIEQQSSNIGRQINEIQVQPTRRPNSKFRSGRQLDDRPPVQQTQSGDLTIGAPAPPTERPGSRKYDNVDRRVPGGSPGVSQTTASCTGLKGSPYTVPGMDAWCRTNCAAGYCPVTHCQCDLQHN